LETPMIADAPPIAADIQVMAGVTVCPASSSDVSFSDHSL
jgi:hypothetical protein